MENWRARDISYLSTRVEDLERQLRWRTYSLVSVLVLGGLLAATATVFAVLPLNGSEPPPATREAALVHEAPAEPPLVAEAEQTEPALAAVRSGGSRALEPQEETVGKDPTTAGRADERTATSAETGDAALRAALAAAKERIAELEAAGARHEATITELRTELEGTGAEARALGEQLEVGRRGIEELNAMLAAMVAGGGHATNGEGPQAGPREAGGAESAPAPAMVRASVGARGESVYQDAAPAEVTVRAAPAEQGGDGTRATGGAPSYAAIRPVNLRAAPSNEAEVLAVVEQEDVVRGIGRQGGWLQVEYGDRLGEDVIGWVHNRYLRRTEPPHEGRGPSAQADN